MKLKPPEFLTTRPLFSDFFPDPVFTYISGPGMDFTLKGTDEPFNSAQKNCLDLIPGIKADDIVNIKQVHGNKVIIVPGTNGGIFEADGLLTRRAGLPLVVRTADCLPVFLFDVQAPAVGLVHAGWRGTRERILSVSVRTMMEEFGTKPAQLLAAFGPCIRAPRYEVGEEFTRHFPREVTRKDQKYYFDLALANQNQLTELGVHRHNIFDCGICTFDDRRYHSFRRDGQKAGRILSMIMLKG